MRLRLLGAHSKWEGQHLGSTIRRTFQVDMNQSISTLWALQIWDCSLRKSIAFEPSGDPRMLLLSRAQGAHPDAGLLAC